MTAKKDLFGLVDAGGEVRRPPLVGMQFLHERPVRSPDLRGGRARLNAKDLIGLLVRHFSGARRAALPRCRVTLRVFTPAGLPAVKISGEERLAFRIDLGEEADKRWQIERVERSSLLPSC